MEAGSPREEIRRDKASDYLGAVLSIVSKGDYATLSTRVKFKVLPALN